MTTYMWLCDDDDPVMRIEAWRNNYLGDKKVVTCREVSLQSPRLTLIILSLIAGPASRRPGSEPGGSL